MCRRYLKPFLLIFIAIILFLGDFAINLISPDIQPIVDQNPAIKNALWCVIGFCLSAAIWAFLRESKTEEDTKATSENPFPTQSALANRRAMLGRVYQNQIKDVLHKSLWKEVPLVLNFEGRPDAVIHPCDLARRRAGSADIRIARDTSILEIYRQEQGELLLLGEPGAGKTTLLLEIAESLLQEAQNNEESPIPVVFELSSWRETHTRLDEWMVERLWHDYTIPDSIAKQWVETGALLLLLDGLDEVAASRRAACVEAINQYRQKHQRVLSPMVICCRAQEYDEIPDLRLNLAIVIQPLTRPQVDDYLKQGGRALSGLKAVLKDEPELYDELFQTPLMLNVAVLTYENQSAAALRRDVSLPERRRQLWNAYIERMFERKQEEQPRYSQAQAIAWLEWLGDYLSRKNLQKYLIEEMQPNDVLQWWQAIVVRWFLPTLGVGMISFAFPVPVSSNAVYIGLIYILLPVRVFYEIRVRLQPAQQFNLSSFRKKWKDILVLVEAGLSQYILFVFMIGAAFGAVVGAMGGAVAGAMGGGEFIGRSIVVGGLMGGLMGIFIVIQGFGLAAALFEGVVPESTLHPNERIHHTLRTALAGALAGALTGPLVGEAFDTLLDGAAPGTGLFATAWYAAFKTLQSGGVLLAVIIGAIIGAMNYGGVAVYQHYFLRFFLWRSGKFPRDITDFLDWAAQRALVQRSGGGWKFVHRTLQEHFATAESLRTTEAQNGAET